MPRKIKDPNVSDEEIEVEIDDAIDDETAVKLLAGDADVIEKANEGEEVEDL